MAAKDGFRDIARYYDRIMSHVTYDRWFAIASALAGLLPRGFCHLDLACGTGTLLKKMRQAGWNSVGADLSFAMLQAGKIRGRLFPLATADMRALPFRDGLDYVTCLFDSVNFLLSVDDLTTAFREVAGALKPGGLFYFDIVTERMVCQHFANQEWTEHNGSFATTWRSLYYREKALAETRVRVNSGPEGTVFERIFSHSEIASALDAAKLSLLAAFDAHSWKAPNRRSTRIDYIAFKPFERDKARAREFLKRFERIREETRRRLS